jgi:hypothetical protein
MQDCNDSCGTTNPQCKIVTTHVVPLTLTDPQCKIAMTHVVPLTPYQYYTLMTPYQKQCEIAATTLMVALTLYQHQYMVACTHGTTDPTPIPMQGIHVRKCVHLDQYLSISAAVLCLFLKEYSSAKV